MTRTLCFFYHSLKDLSSSPVEQKKVLNALNSLPAVWNVMTLIEEVKKVSEVNVIALRQNAHFELFFCRNIKDTNRDISK